MPLLPQHDSSISSDPVSSVVLSFFSLLFFLSVFVLHPQLANRAFECPEGLRMCASFFLSLHN